MSETEKKENKLNRGVKMDPERNKRILEASKAGKTLRAIGAEFGVSRERVRQIIRTMNKDETIPGGLEAGKATLRKLKITTRVFKNMSVDAIKAIEDASEEDINILLKLHD